mmetsp:Transcript_14055/g.37970  ORF Transcript_14055/g.37970 Transcript_14055/m.37970 type:complete len:213 (-) Transcript_14055:582-1220(-)
MAARKPSYALRLRSYSAESSAGGSPRVLASRVTSDSTSRSALCCASRAPVHPDVVASTAFSNVAACCSGSCQRCSCSDFKASSSLRKVETPSTTSRGCCVRSASCWSILSGTGRGMGSPGRRSSASRTGGLTSAASREVEDAEASTSLAHFTDASSCTMAAMWEVSLPVMPATAASPARRKQLRLRRPNTRSSSAVAGAFVTAKALAKATAN